MHHAPTNAESMCLSAMANITVRGAVMKRYAMFVIAAVLALFAVLRFVGPYEEAWRGAVSLVFALFFVAQGLDAKATR